MTRVSLSVNLREFCDNLRATAVANGACIHSNYVVYVVPDIGLIHLLKALIKPLIKYLIALCTRYIYRVFLRFWVFLLPAQLLPRAIRIRIRQVQPV